MWDLDILGFEDLDWLCHMVWCWNWIGIGIGIGIGIRTSVQPG